MFINDLTEAIKNSGIGVKYGELIISLLLYADDVALLAESESDLQKLINITYQWCSKWKTNVNITKSNVVHYQKANGTRTNFKFTYGNETLDTVSKYKYLGCFLSESLDFTVTAESLASAAGRALGGLITKFRHHNGLSFKVFAKLYNMCVIPIMNYCSGVWGVKHYQACDNISNRAIRSFLGVHRFASLPAIYGDTGWIPSHVTRKLDVLRLWNRLTCMDEHRLTKLVFLEDFNNEKKGWCNDIKKIFEDIDAMHQYNNMVPVNLSSARTAFIIQQKEQWNKDIKSQDKLRTYRTFKSEFGLETYVQCDLSRSERSLIAQLRCGILPLAIETGRYTQPRKTPVDERLCTICKTGAVESETHFIFDCEVYRKERSLIITDNMKTFAEFISKSKTIKKCARYLTTIFNIRKYFIYK